VNALRSLAFALAGFISGSACGLGLAVVLVNLLDRAGLINHGGDGLGGMALLFALGAVMAIGGGIVAAILIPGRARSAGAGSALLWVGMMMAVAAGCYLLLAGPLTSVVEVETIGGA